MEKACESQSIVTVQHRTPMPSPIFGRMENGKWHYGGEADIYLDEAPQNSDSELQNSMHIHCAFDGSEDEIMISGSIKMTEVVSYVEDTGYQQRASSYNFADYEWKIDGCGVGS